MPNLLPRVRRVTNYLEPKAKGIMKCGQLNKKGMGIASISYSSLCRELLMDALKYEEKRNVGVTVKTANMIRIRKPETMV